MSDEITPDIGGDIKEGDQVPLVIHGQYIKDLSFEIPGAPQVFIEPPQGQPDLLLHHPAIGSRLSRQLIKHGAHRLFGRGIAISIR